MKRSDDGCDRRSLPALAAALAIAVAGVGCGTDAETSSRPRPDVETTAAAEIVASAKGRIDIEGGVVRLAARRDGVIETVLVDEGAHVKAGQILARLDDALAQRQLDLARGEARQAERAVTAAHIRLTAAEREAQRLEPLAGDAIVARQDLDRARDEQALAQAELESLQAGVETAVQRVLLAQREVEERLVRAPVDGRIVQRQARPGNGVSTLNVTPLFLFAPDAPMIVRAELEERFLGAVAPGQRAEIVLEADPARRWTGRVVRIGQIVGQRTPSDDPSERQDSRVVDTVISIDANDLLIGQRVIVQITVRAEETGR